ncbi:XTP/dITP diphosphatase [Aneurinibacillus terranovensis]|uniref:XTP/dITP diphosphatase n=1 Tax=Aneurinibacillus terranovensis TaxID=278991 RepID=UPI00042382A7|nr:XTP/dITP diphosphatase [Aneurinibacillus terranovensis]
MDNRSFPWETIVLATRNKGKIREFEQMLAGYAASIQTVEHYPGLPEVEEDGDTFEANAIKKAETICAATGQAALADDSGLEVDALNGMPGVYSARFAGQNANDEANNKKLISLVRDLPPGQRHAKFVAVLALAAPGEKTMVVRGECEGEIVLFPSGEGGFGYDPYFFLPEFGKTMAELSAKEKNKISHRGKAIRKLESILRGRCI